MIPFRISFAHIARNRLRSLLTLLSVTVTIFLFCTLRTVITTLDGLTAGSRSSRVVTMSAVSLFVQLPISMRRKLEGVPGVAAVTHWTWFGGIYQNEANFFARFAVDVPSLRKTYGDEAPQGSRDIVVDSADWDAFAADRRSCIIGSGLAKRFHWKKGSRIPLVGNIFPGDYEFTVVGIYEPGSTSFDRATMFFHWDYMNEVAGQPNRVSTYTLLLSDPNVGPDVTARVDEMFKNSPTRTRTLTERAFNAQFVEMWGNVPLLLTIIGAAVFFACFMITLNTMLLLARERFRETGILKALGFSGSSIAALSLFESILLCVLGTILGIAIASVAFQTEGMSLENFLPGFKVQAATMRMALGLGMLLGVVSGVVPALWLRRLPVIDALRKVG